MGRPRKEQPNRADGTYEIKVTVGKDPQGRPIRKSFYSTISKADAKAKAEAYKVAQTVKEITGESPEPSAETFRVWAMRWLETYKKGSVSQHTYNFTYKTPIQKYMIPYFGSAKMVSIRPVDVQGYFNTVNNDGEPFSESILKKHKMILNAIFQAAIDNDVCYKNPVKNITFTQCQEKQKRPVYNAKQVETLRAYAAEKSAHSIVILIGTGLRRGELCGLRWEDVDLENQCIHVRQAVSQTSGKVTIGKPKTKTSVRSIPIAKDLCDYLGSMPRDGVYVIKALDGTEPITPHSFSDWFERFMRDFSDETGLAKLTPHELRHTYGTVLRERGVDIYTIQKVMGHSDISVTASVYVHNDLDVLKRNMGL